MFQARSEDEVETAQSLYEAFFVSQLKHLKESIAVHCQMLKK